MRAYSHRKIEKKWQKEWAKKGLYTTPDKTKSKDNFYLLTEFSYPSGNLHVGHWYAFSVPDILARALRMQGKNVLYPTGFDAFGLPAENAAIKSKLNPRVWTEKNMAYMKKQIESMGASFDWSRQVVTCDPDYYRWTQWQFLQFFKKGLAYRKDTPANWCPSCKTVLANEQVAGGKCERCGAEVEQRQMLQWNLKITDYADRLIDDLDGLDWPEQIKEAQRNWIGRSEGAEIDFPILESDVKRVVLLHGKGGSPASGTLAWLKERLNDLGYEVQIPALPNTDEPDDEEQADYVEKNCTLDENTVIVGHSFGGIVVLRLLERGYRVKRVALVSTPYTDKFLDGKKRKTVSVAIKKGFDFEKIKGQVVFVLLYDINDSVVSMSDGETFAVKLGCSLTKSIAQQSHYCGATEPDVLSVSMPAIRIFTTRADTLFGATYLVLAPEHKMLENLKQEIINKKEVENYIAQTRKMSDLERQENKEKTGVRLEGVMAINPATQEKIPVYVADYVLPHYGTGAIMAVPAHDERDLEFAKKFGLPVRQVIGSDGILVDSDGYNGLTSEEAKQKITEKFGTPKKVYRLRDWIVSRQRYWGVPIPIIHCDECGVVAVPDKDLPVKLPEVKDYLPDGNGKSPLAKVKKWVNVKCPKCKAQAKRETDTLDTFVDSSWYFLRYADPKNKQKFADAKKMANWIPVDLYSGGAEHTTMHLLYSRFWYKALYDLKLVGAKEPYTRRMNRSIILGPDGQKMSKSKGNVIDPDAVVSQLGADTVRMYLAFIGPYNEVASYPWNPDGVVGIRRFLERVWRVSETVKKTSILSLDNVLHKTIKKVGEDIAVLKFNTAISALMIFLNAVEKEGQIGTVQWSAFLRLLAPFAPHLAEELWSGIGNKKSVHLEKWPKYDASKLKEKTVTIAIQINGKTRGTVTVSQDASKEDQEVAARAIVADRLSGQTVTRTIIVPDRLVNFVIAQ